MNKYKFLLKPVFFVFNLLFATWLVLSIEKVKPSDFGDHNSLFTGAPRPRILTKSDKMVLKTFCMEYKYGLIDTAQLSKKLDLFLAPPPDPRAEPKVSQSKNLSSK